MSVVRKFLDLSTAHLPFDLCVGDEGGGGRIDTIEGITAYQHVAYGWFVHVPNVTDVEMNDEDGLPPELVRIFQHARSLDCDYVLFDRDANVDDALPTWKW